jgi:polyhydroxybutyrate depolymerase
VVGLLSFLSLAAAGPLPAQSDRVDRPQRTIEVAGATRSYLLHRPTSRAAAQPIPLLFVFHGAGGSGANIARHTGLTEAATARGYAVVYPDAVGRRWNDGRSTGSTADDVGFVRALLEELRRELPADPRRIYATGISNGAALTFRLACELPGTFAAIAPVAGALPAALEERCAAGSPLSVMLFQGTRDRLMPYDGGDLSWGRGRVLAAPRTAALFGRVNGCAMEPVWTVEADTVADGTRVRRASYGECRSGTGVVLFAIEGGGHTWPGGPPVGRAVGRVTRDLEATRAMLDFFDRHPRPEPDSAR